MRGREERSDERRHCYDHILTDPCSRAVFSSGAGAQKAWKHRVPPDLDAQIRAPPYWRRPHTGLCRTGTTLTAVRSVSTPVDMVASHNLRRLWKTAFQTQPPPGVNAPWRPDRDPGSEALIGRNELSRRAHPELSMTLMVDLRIRPARAIQYWRDLPGTPGRQSATVTSRQRRHRSSFDGKDGRPRTN